MIFLSLGSSIGNAEAIFERAEKSLEDRDVKVIKKSSVLKNPPYGGVAKNEFSNAVWQVGTDLKPHQLLDVLLKVEQEQGRRRNQKWDDRTLDIDILMYDDQVIDDETLTIPHPDIRNRRFVLEPWAEIVDEAFQIPTLGKLKGFLEDLQKLT